MSSRATDFRDLLAKAARELRAAEPLRILVKRKARLARQGEPLGCLEALLRLSFYGEGKGKGVLAFDWPESASGHSIVGLLERWLARADAPGESAISVEGRRAPGGEGAPATAHLKVTFPAGGVPDEMLELLDLAARVGLADAARDRVERGLAPRPAAAAPTPPAAGEAGPERAKVDAITPNAVFDPAKHPRVAVNDEVTNSEGVTFRLIARRVGGAHKRVWTKVPGAAVRSGAHG